MTKVRKGDRMIVMVIFVLFIVFLASAGIMSERKEWNKGVCYKTGKSWIQFDRDSQGGRGYNSGENYCWISYPFIDKYKLERLDTIHNKDVL